MLSIFISGKNQASAGFKAVDISSLSTIEIQPAIDISDTLDFLSRQDRHPFLLTVFSRLVAGGRITLSGVEYKVLSQKHFIQDVTNEAYEKVVWGRRSINTIDELTEMGFDVIRYEISEVYFNAEISQ